MFENVKIKIMKGYLFLEYPACGTCRKAKKWLDFNTSGLLYKSMQLREKLDGMSEEEQLELLASDGKLVKRPLVIGEDFVLVGFKPEEWEKVLLK